MNPNPEWERVLADVEADVARTQAVFAAAGASPDEVAALAAPVDAVHLPELATMPEVPPDLVVRMLALQEQISIVRVELERALADTAAQLAAIAQPAARLHLITGGADRTESHYIDRIA